MPTTSLDQIANEAILELALQHTRKLSVVLRSTREDDSNDDDDDDDDSTTSLASLRRYVGEVYSALWDTSIGGMGQVLDILVYPQNLPNAAPEQWVHARPDLECVVSHDSLIGWTTDSVSGRGNYYEQSGAGGLDAHVEALNVYRQGRGLKPVEALHVSPWPKGANLQFLQENNVWFMDDDALSGDELGCDVVTTTVDNDDEKEAQQILPPTKKERTANILGGAHISQTLFSSVAVGGTFDGMHYGHRKLLTLAVSSVLPQTGRLFVGVTADEMLKNKQYAHLIPSFEERLRGVKQFIYDLAPGMKNRLVVEKILDPLGPPGTPERAQEYDALVLSHETLETGHLLNKERATFGAKPLVLLCTRRTEPYAMSSTALRRLRSIQEMEEEQQKEAKRKEQQQQSSSSSSSSPSSRR
eukprot:CAMPEP_0194029410 /NCGR_PEP_ID=MMETSP0009_2-20130614/3129_1 /TAXON_ID=210454 /ORGANISM="Grammatophora oceanica, Strain CCMP 410" /LENGTH=413 /DNA_ID=CAMNT_0038669059 /DNA_START=434 /DNA_END=1675 /DNA_ORIENTATION=+